MHNTHTVLPPRRYPQVEWKPPAYRKERRYKNRYEPGRGSEKRGNKGGTSKKAANAGTKGRDRQREGERDSETGRQRKGGERQKGEGAECMEIRSHAIQL